MILHCDSCGVGLGEYLYGIGGVAEKAIIFGSCLSHRLPDILCLDCYKNGYSVENPKNYKKVCGK